MERQAGHYREPVDSSTLTGLMLLVGGSIATTVVLVGSTATFVRTITTARRTGRVPRLFVVTALILGVIEVGALFATVAGILLV